jgi:hypothetical protein
MKTCPRYEHPTSYHKLNFPTQIFYGTVFFICIVLVRSTLDTFSPFFTFHGLILLLVFRFLCVEPKVFPPYPKNNRPGISVFIALPPTYFFPNLLTYFIAHKS